jgi:hypothetical protein
MNLPSQLQFRLLPPEAQRAALHRLALRGCDPMSISVQTGVPEGEVRRQLGRAAPGIAPSHVWRGYYPASINRVMSRSVAGFTR